MGVRIIGAPRFERSGSTVVTVSPDALASVAYAPRFVGLPSSFTFTQGIPSSYDIEQYVTDPDTVLSSLSVSLNGSLPAGVTFSSNTLWYDGVGIAGSVSGLSFTASDGVLSTTSPTFTVTTQAS